MVRKAVILVSGGLDSSTVLAMLANEKKYELYALSFNYGQNHVIELERIKDFISGYNIAEHRTINLDLSAFESSALIGKRVEVPHYKKASDLGGGIPVTYVPARNTIFLSYALGYAEVIGALDIFIGAHNTDCANYPDCRPEYLKSFENMANLATKSGVEGNKINIHAPLIALSKTEIVQKGLSLGVDYTNTISCYSPNIEGESCSTCHACLVRLEAFANNKVQDPIIYLERTHPF